MFGYEDKRTPEERKRDADRGAVLRANQHLALGFLKTFVRHQLDSQGTEVGIPSLSDLWRAEMMVERDGVTYRILVEVDHD